MIHVAAGFFVWLLGLCVGSFLNVVVYRLPRGLSVTNPPRSFCPGCDAAIAARDNIPLLSWVLLGGRCRHCRTSISAQYPLIEAITGLAFVLVYHLLAVGEARAGVSILAWPDDLPLVAAWLVLVAAMVACSAMDVVAYTIDIRVTNVCIAAGVLSYAVWPMRPAFAGEAQSPAAAAAQLGSLALVAMLYVSWRRGARNPLADEEPEAPPASRAAPLDRGESHDLPGGAPAGDSLTRKVAVVGMASFVLIAVALLLFSIVPGEVRVEWMPLAGPAAISALFVSIVVAGAIKRDADEEIEAAIEEERHEARGNALRELGWLSPIVVAIAVGFVAVWKWPSAQAFWVTWTTVCLPGTEIAPLAGVAWAVLSAFVAATAGWVLRIFFTLAFGREAFGAGDIHILAAAGAAAGWDIALLGLLLAVGFALLGWLLGLMLKSTAIIPFGPWLAIGFVAALWINKPAAAFAAEYRDTLIAAWREAPHVVLIGCGFMGLAVPVAIVLARMLRVWLEREPPG